MRFRQSKDRARPNRAEALSGEEVRARQLAQKVREAVGLGLDGRRATWPPLGRSPGVAWPMVAPLSPVM